MAWFSRSRRTRTTADRPPKQGILVPAPATFEQFRSELDSLVSQVLPYGIDVYTPDFLDKLIESRALQSRAEIWIAHASDVEKVMPALLRAQAEQAYQEVIYKAKHRYLAELEAARDAAVRALLGPEDDPPEQPTERVGRDQESSEQTTGEGDGDDDDE